MKRADIPLPTLVSVVIVAGAGMTYWKGVPRILYAPGVPTSLLGLCTVSSALRLIFLTAFIAFVNSAPA